MSTISYGLRLKDLRATLYDIVKTILSVVEVPLVHAHSLTLVKDNSVACKKTHLSLHKIQNKQQAAS